MIDVSLLRIDDRLIHGQIIARWISHLNCNMIVVADDKAANDSLQKTLLQMATPNNINLKILSVEDAVEFLNDEKEMDKALVLVRNVESALKLIKNGIMVESLNVGNLSMDPAKERIFKSIWVDNTDIEGLREIESLGIQVIIRVVPEEKPISFFHYYTRGK